MQRQSTLRSAAADWRDVCAYSLGSRERVADRHGIHLLLRNAGKCGVDNDLPASTCQRNCAIKLQGNWQRNIRDIDSGFLGRQAAQLNVTTAKALGLAIPPALLAIADEVIE